VREMSELAQFKKKQLKIVNLVDNRISEFFQDEHPLLEGLIKSIQYSISGGKRVRSVFMFLVGEVFDVPIQKLISNACAVEMIHASSLIMDDLPYMDNSELRRGKPANHIIFGQDVALCASIALISKSIEMVVTDKNLSYKEKKSVTEILSRSFSTNGLAGGQFVDLKLKRKNVELEVLEFINVRKTAALFTAAGEIAANLGGANKVEIKKMVEYANYLGFTFQVIDDILDLRGDEKLVGKDLKKDKINFAKLVGLEKAEEYAEEYMRKATAAINYFQEKKTKLLAFGEYLLNRVK
jgi:geranylgeranyl diphosphate synthase type II